MIEVMTHDGADGERVEHHLHDAILAAGEIDGREHHGGHDGDHIGLEQVGRHTGAVADIVAHIVGNGRRVARIVLGDARLNLADEIAADIGALGEDAAAETSEDGDERCAEAESDKGVDYLARGGIVADQAGEDEKIDRDAEEGETGDEKPGDGAGAEGEAQAVGKALGRGLGGPHIGADGDVHADIAGDAREHRTDGETDRLRNAEQIGEDGEDHHADDGDRGVLAREIGLRPFLDGGGDLLHARGAGVGSENGPGRPDAIGDGERPASDNEKENPGHDGCLYAFNLRSTEKNKARRRDVELCPRPEAPELWR